MTPAGSAWIRSRRGAVATASAAVVCLGTLLAVSGGGSGGDGYVAVGATGAGSPGRTVAPTGDVEMVPLEGREGGEGASGAAEEESAGRGAPESGSATEGAAGGGASPGAGGNSGPGDGSSGEAGSGEAGSGEAGSGAGGPAEESGEESPGGGGSSGPGTGSGSPGAPPSGPAALDVGKPVREALKDRWCEKVTVKFRNTGGEPVRSGTVTFGTHIIGGLGIDWATIESERELPAPLEPGEDVTKSWNICVDDWRVPLGMHIETQDVSVKWK